MSKNNKSYIDSLYKRLHRHGHLRRDCQRLINQDRNVFAASMVSSGDADAMITGVTRPFGRCFDDITKVISPKNDELNSVYKMPIEEEEQIISKFAENSLHLNLHVVRAKSFSCLL